MNVNIYVNGEGVCQLVRDLFWIENLNYDECEQILLQCIDNLNVTLHEKKIIVQDIIEGRKKLVGKNIFSIVDDNSDIKLISSKLSNNKKQEMIDKIRLDMLNNPYNYIDPFSTVKSIIEFDRRKSDDCNFDDIYKYFACDDNGNEYKAFSRPSKCGLWLIGDAEFVFDVYGKPIPCKITRDEYDDFWEKVYQKIKDDNNFSDRNDAYLYRLKLRDEMFSLVKEISNGTIDIFKHSKNNVEKPLNVPTGIIDTDGNFFPCGFGEHEYLAKNIFNKYHFDLKDYKSYLDCLICHNFAALRTLPNIGYYVSCWDLRELKDKQYQKIEEIEKEFNVRFNFNIDSYVKGEF